MSSGLSAIWRARPQRLGRSTHQHQHHYYYHHEPLCARPRPIQLARSTRLHYSTRYLTAPGDPEYPLVDEAPESHRLKNGTRAAWPFDAPQRVHPQEESFTKRAKKPKNLSPRDKEIWELEEALERSQFANSVLVPVVNVSGTARQRHRLERKVHKAITRQVDNAKYSQTPGTPLPDWRILLQAMAQSTPAEPPEFLVDAIKIQVPPEIMARVIEAAGDDSFGAIRTRTGAVIKMYRGESTVVLSGTRQAINTAIDAFKHIAGNITVTRQYRPLLTGEAAVEESDGFIIPPLSREEGAVFHHIRIKKQLEPIPIGVEWTPETLKDYVLSLIDTFVAPYLHMRLYPPEREDQSLDHERAIVRRLLRLFRSLPSGSGGALSCSVVKFALQYMTQKGDKYLPEARKLFVFLEQQGIPLDTDVFNTLLYAPVKMRNTRKFQQTIWLMKNHGCSPNVKTWLMFLRLFESVDVKHYILQNMNAKNMLATPVVIQRIASEMAPHDAEHAMRQGKSLEIFLREQEARYGSNWLTVFAGNKVLHVLGLHDRYEDCFKLLDLMCERYHAIPKSDAEKRKLIGPDTVTVHTILNHAWVKNKIRLAYNLLRKMKTAKLARRLRPVMLHVLFKMAWLNRHRTSLCAIWRYAALARLTTWGMRKHVGDLLLGKVGGMTEKNMYEKTYRELGGETLACELVGGREALEQLRQLCKRMHGDELVTASKLGAAAARMLPLAFKEYGPAVPLATVLCQSNQVDHKCLRGIKTNGLRELLATAKVKSVPLWPRDDQAEDKEWTDLAALKEIEPSAIRHDDPWDDEWDSEGWEASERDIRAWRMRRSYDRAPSIDSSLFSTSDPPSQGAGTGAETGKSLAVGATHATEPSAEMRMVVINPHVWDEQQHFDLTPLQEQNAQACLAGVEALSKQYTEGRYVFEESDDESTDVDLPARDEDAAATDAGDESNDKTQTAGAQMEEPLISHQDVVVELQGAEEELDTETGAEVDEKTTVDAEEGKGKGT